jgi:hypothetical protein
MAPHWKCGLGVIPSRVRIPLSPPALPARNATFPRFGMVSSSTPFVALGGGLGGESSSAGEVLPIGADELLHFAGADGGVRVIAELRLDGDESPGTVYSDEVHAPLDARQARLGASRPLLPAPALHQAWMPTAVDPAHQSCLPGRPLGRAVWEGADLRL